ncbi:hypothetical protein [Paenibacillus periandrae]|uniref:hypothetical protein n=1 Tax=Paenibacillus periandrae TaxID=1761741 RepID=UPI001F09D4A1|nr:hypothetical protein [Paenibacillus periandrae]
MKDVLTWEVQWHSKAHMLKVRLIKAIQILSTILKMNMDRHTVLLKKDIDGELPKSPEEAIAIQNSRSPCGRDIPLYDVDGETVIGVVHVGGN